MNRISLANKTILITGAAGFIGANLVTALMKSRVAMKIVGLDNMNDYYDKFVVKGQVLHQPQYHIARVESTVKKILTTDYVQEQLITIHNIVLTR